MAQVDFEPVTATLGDYEITILGAEHFLDTDGKDAIRIYDDDVAEYGNDSMNVRPGCFGSRGVFRRKWVLREWRSWCNIAT